MDATLYRESLAELDQAWSVIASQLDESIVSQIWHVVPTDVAKRCLSALAGRRDDIVRHLLRAMPPKVALAEQDFADGLRAQIDVALPGKVRRFEPLLGSWVPKTPAAAMCCTRPAALEVAARPRTPPSGVKDDIFSSFKAPAAVLPTVVRNKLSLQSQAGTQEQSARLLQRYRKILDSNTPRRFAVAPPSPIDLEISPIKRTLESPAVRPRRRLFEATTSPMRPAKRVCTTGLLSPVSSSRTNREHSPEHKRDPVKPRKAVVLPARLTKRPIADLEDELCM